MPYLVRFLIGHAVIGFGVALATVAMIIVFDVAGLGTLAFESESGLLAVSLLTFFMGLTFGSAQMGFAVMRQGSGGKTGGPHRCGDRHSVVSNSAMSLSAVSTPTRP